jgi:hypothetical protein
VPWQVNNLDFALRGERFLVKHPRVHVTTEAVNHNHRFTAFTLHDVSNFATVNLDGLHGWAGIFCVGDDDGLEACNKFSTSSSLTPSSAITPSSAPTSKVAPSAATCRRSTPVALASVAAESSLTRRQSPRHPQPQPAPRRHAPFRNGDGSDWRLTHFAKLTVRRTASAICAGVGTNASSSSGANGTGTCGGETISIGPFNAPNARRATIAEISVAMLQRG